MDIAELKWIIIIIGLCILINWILIMILKELKFNLYLI